MSQRSRLGIFIAVAIAALVISVVGGLTGDFLDEQSSVQADAFSVSALGHHVFIDWIRASGHPVLIARALATRRAAAEQPVLMLEPRPDSRSELHASDIRNRTAPTLLVLGKREGKRADSDSNWLGSVDYISAHSIQELLDASGVGGKVVRDTTEGAVAKFDTGVYGNVTLKIANAQLLTESRLEPLIETDSGILLGRTTDNRPIYVLSDPDVLENHGIGAPGRIEFLRALVDELALSGEPIVVDETVHGAGTERSFWREAVKMPLLPATLGSLLTLIVVWLGVRRFGRPLKADHGLAPGKRVLIDSMAELQLAHGRPYAMLKRYRALVEHDTLRALGVLAPMGLVGSGASDRAPSTRRRSGALGSFGRHDESACHDLLVRRSKARGLALDLDAWLEPFENTKLRRKVDEQRVLDAIAELRRWQEEITSGPSVD